MLSFYLQAAAEGLPSAAPVYVDEEIVALLDVARTSLPAARLDESDVFIPSGFVWFEQAFPLFYEENDLSGFGWTVTASLEGAPVVAMTSFVEGNGMVLPQQVIPLTFGEVPEEVDGSPFVRLAVSFWLLSSQRLFASAQERVSRAARRRAKSEIKTVLVATIRRKVYPEAGGTRSVEWSHRWLVGGHWRNQWFPGEQRHKPVWIAPYVKGPEGKPLVAKGRAFEFKR
jgi:hypothetical protein